jgi:hypothetical protein
MSCTQDSEQRGPDANARPGDRRALLVQLRVSSIRICKRRCLIRHASPFARKDAVRALLLHRPGNHASELVGRRGCLRPRH